MCFYGQESLAMDGSTWMMSLRQATESQTRVFLSIRAGPSLACHVEVAPHQEVHPRLLWDPHELLAVDHRLSNICWVI